MCARCTRAYLEQTCDYAGETRVRSLFVRLEGEDCIAVATSEMWESEPASRRNLSNARFTLGRWPVVISSNMSPSKTAMHKVARVTSSCPVDMQRRAAFCQSRDD